MWKVKRMNTARIVVLTIAIGAGGIAASVACGSDNDTAAPAGRVAQGADIPVAKLGRERLPRQIRPDATASNNFIDPRGESFSVVRYDAGSRQSMPKWLKGRTI